MIRWHKVSSQPRPCNAERVGDSDGAEKCGGEKIKTRWEKKTLRMPYSNCQGPPTLEEDNLKAVLAEGGEEVRSKRKLRMMNRGGRIEGLRKGAFV